MSGRAPDVVANLARVRGQIAAACRAAGRAPDSVQLVAASKTVDPQILRQTIEAGLLSYGENRVQEGAAKWPLLRQEFPGLELHLIGPLQTNKARDAVALFDVIHALDRVRLGEALARQCVAQERRPRVLVQVNTGAEQQKSGVLPAEADALLERCRRFQEFDLVGLMCIPPYEGDPRPHFEMLVKIAERHGLSELSMGMSHNYESAIEHGATQVRVGTAIFGARDYPAGGA
ncbi:YggS family pyridoxal phosphate-dependent enzyme [Kineosporia mesophila]|uniref:Pyridoxal phosphate homeostasis protein n=1 Tax=Kineosporia mesophila TaxID=566012 RepID=A0ABP7AAL7_9ACTN